MILDILIGWQTKSNQTNSVYPAYSSVPLIVGSEEGEMYADHAPTLKNREVVFVQTSALVQDKVWCDTYVNSTWAHGCEHMGLTFTSNSSVNERAEPLRHRI